MLTSMQTATQTVVQTAVENGHRKTHANTRELRVSRPLLVIVAFVLWAAGSTYWYTCKLKRVCAADAGTAAVADVAKDASPAPAANPASAALPPVQALQTPAPPTATGPEINTAPATASIPTPSATAALAKSKTKPVRVLFPIRKAKRHPNEAVTRQLQAIADQLKVSGRAIVTGFTDERGGEDMNMNLAQRRAESVREELIALGAPAALIDVMAVGPQTPLASNDTIMGRQLNRRVDITLQ
jgi:outer membrane protein OmpA-like peptidoglycan-associated protein